MLIEMRVISVLIEIWSDISVDRHWVISVLIDIGVISMLIGLGYLSMLIDESHISVDRHWRLYQC